MISEIGGYISYQLTKQTGIPEKIRELNDFIAAKREDVDGAVREVEGVLQVVQVAAGKAGVGQHSLVFGQQAKKNRRVAWGWLGLAAVFGVLSTLYVFMNLFGWVPSSETIGEVVGEIGGRFAILTLLAFALTFALRQYSSSRHNETVNLHRQNALQTFETFVGAASDQEIKDAVLLEATRSIFAPQSSGFLRSRQEAESPSMMVEVIRRLGSGSSNTS